MGQAFAAAGAGPAPYNVHGSVYLAGPYKGAPISLAIVVPATAGPFDLGTVVTKIAVQVDSRTAQLTATSDPIPSIMKGVPLDIRSLSIRLDKPDFTLNPTSCDPTEVTGSLFTLEGSSMPLNNRFQLAECGRLKLKPKLSLSLKGGSERRKFPALTAVLENRAGDANLEGERSSRCPTRSFSPRATSARSAHVCSLQQAPARPTLSTARPWSTRRSWKSL